MKKILLILYFLILITSCTKENELFYTKRRIIIKNETDYTLSNIIVLGKVIQKDSFEKNFSTNTIIYVPKYIDQIRVYYSYNLKGKIKNTSYMFNISNNPKKINIHIKNSNL